MRSSAAAPKPSGPHQALLPMEDELRPVVVEGAQERVTELVRTSLDRLTGSVRLIARNDHDAEDALATALARAWDHLRRGKPIESLEGWVFVVASNELRRAARRRLRERDDPVAASSTEMHPDLGFAALGDAVRALPARQRTTVVLRYWFDLPVAEIARTMGVAEGTAKALLHQARTALRTRLEALEGAVL